VAGPPGGRGHWSSPARRGCGATADCSTGRPGCGGRTRSRGGPGPTRRSWPRSRSRRVTSTSPCCGPVPAARPLPVRSRGGRRRRRGRERVTTSRPVIGSWCHSRSRAARGEPCRRGRTGNCAAHPRMSTYGLGTMGGLEWGGLLADLVAVPHADAMLVALPAGLDPAVASGERQTCPDAWRTVGRRSPPTRGPRSWWSAATRAQLDRALRGRAGGAPRRGRVTYLDQDPARSPSRSRWRPRCSTPRRPARRAGSRSPSTRRGARTGCAAPEQHRVRRDLHQPVGVPGGPGGADVSDVLALLHAAHRAGPCPPGHSRGARPHRRRLRPVAGHVRGRAPRRRRRGPRPAAVEARRRLPP